MLENLGSLRQGYPDGFFQCGADKRTRLKSQDTFLEERRTGKRIERKIKMKETMKKGASIAVASLILLGILSVASSVVTPVSSVLYEFSS